MRPARRAGPSKTAPGDLRLLLAEVSQFLDQVRACLAVPAPGGRESLRHKAAYITTLSILVRNHNFSLGGQSGLSEPQRRSLHGLAAISLLLYRLTNLLMSVSSQAGHLSRPDFLENYALDEFFDEIDLGLAMVKPALEQLKEKQVVRLCQVEERLDALYADRFKRLSEELGAGLGRPGDLVTALMIVHYLERAGDIILEIGEELIHIIFGERLNFTHYQALAAGLKSAGLGPVRAGDFNSIWTGRSGCRLGVVGARDDGPIVFKYGPASKMARERVNIGLWNDLRPGLPPTVKAFVPARHAREAAMILEYIAGVPLKDHFQSAGGEAESYLEEALEIQAGLWRDTLRAKPARAGFARQAEKRLGPVRALYPDLLDFKGAWGRLEIKSLTELLSEAAALEKNLAAPFTVLIHGDFNLSNIMRGPSGSFRFIDLYRSRPSDYAQDLSVMILSLLRLPRGGADRDRLNRAALMVWDFALSFAAENHDDTIEARLSFGLARSYLTSARFETRRPIAARFLGYCRHLLTALTDYGRTGRPWSEFRLDRRLLHI